MPFYNIFNPPGISLGGAIIKSKFGRNTKKAIKNPIVKKTMFCFSTRKYKYSLLHKIKTNMLQ